MNNKKYENEEKFDGEEYWKNQTREPESDSSVTVKDAVTRIDETLFEWDEFETHEQDLNTLPDNENLKTSEFRYPMNGTPRYRGWYHQSNGRSRWCPKQSKFGGRGGDHKGVDLSSDKNEDLYAIVDGNIEYNPRGSQLDGWGNHIYLYFTHNRKRYIAVYAHLDKSSAFEGVKAVRKGARIGRAGCTGNAGKGGICDRTHKCRKSDGPLFTPVSDHLHLELITLPDNSKIAPVAFFGWKIEYADDERCFMCPE
jgi:murein DD-endopeptidase MepM/ murein hydrolase activator NlpD